MSKATDDPLDETRAATDELADTNRLLAEWTASTLENSPALIERMEQMGYRVRGKSREEVTEVLKQPPTGPATRADDA